MARISTAPNLQAIDGLTSFERASGQPLMLGLFLPHQQGAWTPSKAPRQTSWTFDYNAELAVRADELGFDLVFALATWLGKGGHGGESLPERIAGIKSQAQEHLRDVKVLVNPHVICRPTEREARDWCERIRNERDEAALAHFYGGFASGDQTSWRQHSALDWAVGGNIHLVGTPEQIVDWFGRLKRAGVDGVQVNFFDFGPDLDYFAEAVLPLMAQAGLRHPYLGS